MENPEPNRTYDVQAGPIFPAEETILEKDSSASEFDQLPDTCHLPSTLTDLWGETDALSSLPFTASQNSGQNQEMADPPFTEDFGCSLSEDTFAGPGLQSSTFRQQELGKWATEDPFNILFDFDDNRLVRREPDDPINNCYDGKNQLPPDLSYLDSKNHQEYLCQLAEVEMESRRIDLRRDRSKGEVERLRLQIEVDELTMMRPKAEANYTQPRDKIRL